MGRVDKPSLIKQTRANQNDEQRQMKIVRRFLYVKIATERKMRVCDIKGGIYRWTWVNRETIGYLVLD